MNKFEKRELFDSLDANLAAWTSATGTAPYRCRQIRQWLFERRATDWQAMHTLPQSLRDELATSLPLWQTRILRHTRAEDGTEKLLLGLAARGEIECVLLRSGVRRTICISTQVGCGMGCRFCASGLDGLERNLTTGEIVEQMLRLGHLLATEERISHLVVMGMGEPLANLDALLPALDEARRPDGLGISTRRITISTVGLPGGIDRLAQTNSHYRLAISLHAPNDPLRTRLVPTNGSTGLNAILEAADRYFQVSGRRMTFEYVLLANTNDQAEDARQLAQLLSGREALINIIPYNRVEGLPYRTPPAEQQQLFCSILESAGLRVRLRHRRGNRIDAACGQLRRQMRGADEL
jgi:23S rRNA (adenine2503-C2)-methyltransferase